MKLFVFGSRFAFSTTKASPLSIQLLANPNRNAVRFENQNRTWTFSELDAHSNAFAYGLVELGWKAGDKLLLWVESNHTSEIATAQIGAAKSGVTLVNCNAQSAQELAEVLNSTKAQGILLSPNSKAGNQKYIDIINSAIPQLQSTGRGAPLKTSFSNLKQVIHTGFYSFPGTYKFRQILVYASKNFNTLQLPQVNVQAPLLQSGSATFSLEKLTSGIQASLKGTSLNQNTSVVIAGDARSPLSLQLGVLNSLVNGNYSVYTGGQDLNQVNKVLAHYQQPLLLLGDKVASGEAIKQIQSQSTNFAGVLSGNDVQQLVSLAK